MFSMSKTSAGYEHVPSIHRGESEDLAAAYQRVRNQSQALCAPLTAEDCQVQTMPCVSPTKWHLAHVSWFFETFLLSPYLKDYRPYHPRFAHLFNSYYETVGSFHPRPQRGLLSRPTLSQVYEYRAYVDEHMLQLLHISDHRERENIRLRTRVGINHEQQHQELILTDIKHVFAMNPLKPAYQHTRLAGTAGTVPLSWFRHPGGLVTIGNTGDQFCYDNEMPAHQVYLEPFQLASRLVTNGEYLEFMQDNGYSRAEHWLADAWTLVNAQQWQAPLYWEQQDDGQWSVMTLHGMQAINLHEPVCHVSFYEADAFARWAGMRLPGEAEWEVMARDYPIEGNLRDTDNLHPIAAAIPDAMQQVYGDTWEWTQSPYAPYPGFRPLAGSLGEYNGKFMCNQLVLRGGSCVTPVDHIRASYRNFFYPQDRWQFSGIRLARNV